MDKKKRVTALVITVVLVGLLVAGMVALGAHQRRANAPLLVHAVAIDASTLLVRDSRAEWRRLRLDGALSEPVPLGARARIVAHSPELVWVQADGVPLAAYRLPSLSAVPAVARAVSGHDVLSRGVSPRVRTAAGDLIVDGTDGRAYRISGEGRIERVDDDVADAANRARSRSRIERTGSDVFVPIAPWDESRGPGGQELGVAGAAPPLPTDEGPRGYRDAEPGAPELLLSRIDLVNARAVMDFGRGAPIALRSPDSYLVASVDTSRDNNHRVSRVGVDGSIRWTVSAEELVGPTDFGAGQRRVLWLAPRGRQLVMLVNVWRPQQSSSSISSGANPTGPTGETRLVTVDATTGSIVGRLELKR